MNWIRATVRSLFHTPKHRHTADRRPRRTAVALAAFTLALGGLLVHSTPASAAWGSCNTGWVCLYPGLDGTGVPAIKYVPDSGFGCLYLGQGGTNIADSAWNRSGETVWLTDGSDCSGFQYSLLNGAKVADLGAYKNRVNAILYI